MIKLTSGNFVIWQIFVIRSLIAIPVLVSFLILVSSQNLSWLDRLLPVTIRSLMLVAMWVCYYISLPSLTLSAAVASYYTLPIFITLFSAIFTGDKISRRGWLATFIGFTGVLMILRPGVNDFNAYALLPLIAAMLYAGAMILTRTKCSNEDPIILSLALNIAFVVIGTAVTGLILVSPDLTREGFLLAPWAPMGASEWLSMALMAAAILIGSIGAAIAYQNGPPKIIGIFDFAYVGFAVIWGMAFFAEVPDMLSTIGIVMIVGAGLLSMRQ